MIEQVVPFPFEADIEIVSFQSHVNIPERLRNEVLYLIVPLHYEA